MLNKESDRLGGGIALQALPQCYKRQPDIPANGDAKTPKRRHVAARDGEPPQ